MRRADRGEGSSGTPRRTAWRPRECVKTGLAAAVLSLVFGGRSFAIETPSAPAPPAEGAPADARRDPLRFGPVKAGLDSMVRPEAAANFSLGSFAFTPGNDERRILLRVRPSIAAGPSEDLSVRVEGQWYAYYDDTDFSIFSLYQGYAEGRLPGAGGVSFKVGRQEFVYGSAFMLGADAFYDGLVFDAAKLTFRPAAKRSLDLFGGDYVKTWAGAVTGRLYGAYGTFTRDETLSIDLYGFRDTGGAGAVHVGGEHEVTYSVGTRLSGKAGGKLAYEIEPVYQFGRKSRDNASHGRISACGGHADLTVDPPLGRYPGKIFLSYAFGSGDGDPGEGTFTEFHNPNNDSPLVGDVNVIGDLSGLSLAGPGGDVRASGLHVLTAGGGVDVTSRLNVSVDGHYFRAVKVPAGASRDVGFETNLIVTYRISDNVSVLVSENRFFTGQFFKHAAGSGRDINYAYAQLQAIF